MGWNTRISRFLQTLYHNSEIVAKFSFQMWYDVQRKFFSYLHLLVKSVIMSTDHLYISGEKQVDCTINRMKKEYVS